MRGSERDGFGRALVADTLLYSGSAAFALLVLNSSSMLRNTTWAEFAWPAYTGGALAALLLATVSGRLGRRRLANARLLVAAVVLAGAAAVPPRVRGAVAGRAGTRSRRVAASIRRL